MTIMPPTSPALPDLILLHPSPPADDIRDSLLDCPVYQLDALFTTLFADNQRPPADILADQPCILPPHSSCFVQFGASSRGWHVRTLPLTGSHHPPLVSHHQARSTVALAAILLNCSFYTTTDPQLEPQITAQIWLKENGTLIHRLSRSLGDTIPAYLFTHCHLETSYWSSIPEAYRPFATKDAHFILYYGLLFLAYLQQHSISLTAHQPNLNLPTDTALIQRAVFWPTL